MSLITLCLPKMGESVIEATVLDWLIREGDIVVEGSSLLEVATDKVDAEIPALYSGKIKKLLVFKGQIIPIGAPIALLEMDDLSPTSSSTTTTYDTTCFIDSKIDSKSIIPLSSAISTSDLVKKDIIFPLLPFGKIKLSPLARKLVKEYAIDTDEVVKLSKYTKNNRITKKNLLDYIKKNKSIYINESYDSLYHTSSYFNILEGDKIVKIDRIRQLIAERMIKSKQISPHVTSFIRADVTELVIWKNQHKASFEEKNGIKLSYNPIFMAIIARILQLFPLLNSVVLNKEKIIQRKHINIGFAVALPNGNLIVPVIKKVEQLGLITLAKQIDNLIYKARRGTITPDELIGASYTISNIGSFDNLMGTPIIVQPQVAILALGLIERRPSVIHINGKETIAIRSELFLSHTYDHRIIDGSIGGGFLKKLAKELASFVDNLVTYSFT